MLIGGLGWLNVPTIESHLGASALLEGVHVILEVWYHSDKLVGLLPLPGASMNETV